MVPRSQAGPCRTDRFMPRASFILGLAPPLHSPPCTRPFRRSGGVVGGPSGTPPEVAAAGRSRPLAMPPTSLRAERPPFLWRAMPPSAPEARRTAPGEPRAARACAQEMPGPGGCCGVAGWLGGRKRRSGGLEPSLAAGSGTSQNLLIKSEDRWKPFLSQPGQGAQSYQPASRAWEGLTPAGLWLLGVGPGAPASHERRLLFFQSSSQLAAARTTMSGKSLLLKVLLLGDGGVGKTSLMNRYVTHKFDSQAFHTIGVEFLNQDLEVDGRLVTLQIWDTAGQERFKSLRTPFYRGADCCLLTFSIDDRQSFENLGHWQKEFACYANVKDPEHFPFVVLGNKVDKAERQVTAEEARAWCLAHGNYPYLETSAKVDTNVAVAFEEAVRQVLALEEQLEHSVLGQTVSLHPSAKPGSSCC